MIELGNPSSRFCLSVCVKCAGGYWDEAWNIYSDSLQEIEALTQEFYNRRAAMNRKVNSSAYLFGGQFEPDSVEWVICHSVWITIFDGDESIDEKMVKHPYLEAIENRW